MTEERLRQWLHKNVVVVNSVGGGKYKGRIVGFRPGKFALGDTRIISKDGGITSPKHDRTRWFVSARCDIALDLEANAQGAPA